MMFIHGAWVDHRYIPSPSGMLTFFTALLMVVVPTTIAVACTAPLSLFIMLVSMTWQIRWLSIIGRGMGWMAVVINPLDTGLLIVQCVTVWTVLRKDARAAVTYVMVLACVVWQLCFQ